MRALLALFALLPLRAEIAFDLTETVTGHRLMVQGKMTRQRKVWIEGGRKAVQEGPVVTVEDHDTGTYLYVDHERKQFASGPLADAAPQPGRLPQGIRLSVKQAAEPTSWQQVAAERNVYLMEIHKELTGLPMAIEGELTEWTIAAPPAPSAELKKRFAEEQYDREIDAAVQTMSATNVAFLRDLQSARTTRNVRRLPVKFLMQVRFKGEWTITQGLADLVQGESLMRIETEASPLRRETPPAGIFQAPAGYAPARREDLAAAHARRLGL